MIEQKWTSSSPINRERGNGDITGVSMAGLIRPLRKLSPEFCNLRHLLSKTLPHQPSSIPTLLFSTTARSPPSRRRVNIRKPLPSPPEALKPTGIDDIGSDDSDGDSEFDSLKSSRNQRKRDARRAVRWGMELASLSSDQVKRILKAASLGEEVYDALMLAKRLGADVREGKRRHFNYIGKLLRDVEPDLMDTLIHATKHGDHSKLKDLISLAKDDVEDIEEEDTERESEDEEEDYRSKEYMAMATRWFDGLISQNVEVTNEVYSLQTVDFDRQELRKLVREVQLVHQRREDAIEEMQKEVDAALAKAEKSLNRFLCSMAKQMQSEQILYL